MANREGGLPRPKPGVRGVKNPDMAPMKTANWPKGQGGKGPPMNKVGFTAVKAYAAQSLNDG